MMKINFCLDDDQASATMKHIVRETANSIAATMKATMHREISAAIKTAMEEVKLNASDMLREQIKSTEFTIEIKDGEDE